MATTGSPARRLVLGDYAIRIGAVLACWLVIGSTAQAAPPYTRITDGFNFEELIRPALANDGTVVAAQPTQLQVGNGGPPSIIDLAPSNLQLNPGVRGARAVQVRSAGDILFVADHPGVSGCGSIPARGVYRTDTLGAPVSTIFEECVVSPGEKVGPHVSLSNGGTLAFSTILDREGAIRRGSLGGPVSVLRSGNGTFYNTREIVVNDSGQTAVQMEYTDPNAGLVRAVFIFEVPEQALTATDTAFERNNSQPFISMNSNGIVALTFNNNFTMPIDGMSYSFTAGVYTSDPTAFNTPKMMTKIADMSGAYCGFGHIDINDAGKVVFEAQVVGGLGGCGGAFSEWDGLYTGGNPSTDAVVSFGDANLEGHQFYDSVVLGELNENNQVSFLTTYSEPLVEPYIVWRTDLDDFATAACTTLPGGEQWCLVPRTCSASAPGRGDAATAIWLLLSVAGLGVLRRRKRKIG